MVPVGVSRRALASSFVAPRLFLFGVILSPTFLKLFTIWSVALARILPAPLDGFSEFLSGVGTKVAFSSGSLVWPSGFASSSSSSLTIREVSRASSNWESSRGKALGSVPSCPATCSDSL